MNETACRGALISPTALIYAPKTVTFIRDARMTGVEMELPRSRLWILPSVVVALSAVFAFLGVYDTDALPIVPRLLFWGVLMSVGTVATLIVEPWVFRRSLRDQHTMLQLAVIAALVSLPIAAGLVGANTGFSFRWSALNWLLQFLSVFVIAFIMVTGRYIAPNASAWLNPGPKKPAPVDSPVDRFLERLPSKFRGAKLYAVSSEGHYLRVHCDRGEALILMRLSDAVRELAGVDGLQVHRSWWVANEGIEEPRRSSGKHVLVLKSGKSAPVSRSFKPALKAAGHDT